MKWKKPGYEFDGISQKVIEKYNNKKIFIYGAGLVGRRIYHALVKLTDWKVLGFIDSNIEKQGGIFCNLDVFSVQDIELFSIHKLQNVVIIIGLNDEIGEIVKQEIDSRLKLESSICVNYTKFMRHDFPIIALYKYNKIYINSLSLIVTEECTLKCEKCAIMLPYFNKIYKYDLESLKSQVDLVFSKVDEIGDFTITGGEPLLYKKLSMLMEYIGESYGDRIGSIKIISNGTINPNEEMLKAMKKYNISAEISDYTNAVPSIKNCVETSLKLYCDYGINTYFLNTASWVDFGFEYVNKHKLVEDDLIEFFDYCNTKCRGYIDGEICYCINARFAEKALGKAKDNDNILVLKEIGESLEERKKIIEFDMGFNNKGYIKMCRHCNGTCEINKNYIEVGKQWKNH